MVHRTLFKKPFRSLSMIKNLFRRIEFELKHDENDEFIAN